MSTHFVVHADGSSKGNPGYGGFGVFGYTYIETDRPKNVKHPVHATLFFTPSGLSKEKSEQPIEVTHVYEVIHAIDSPSATNNQAELLAVICALSKAKELMGLTNVTVYTDSNYVVGSFQDGVEKWRKNDWKRLDGKPIVHRPQWELIESLKKELEGRGVSVNLIWVKGHNGDHSNEIADLYSVIGSNSARRQLTEGLPFNSRILENFLSYQDFKKSYLEKDIVLYFRDLYFSSDSLDDRHYCFLCTSEDPNSIGKRDTSSIFATNIGYVPAVVNKLKEIYRKLNRNYIATCCIKLSKLEDKDLYRLAHSVGIEELLVRGEKNGSTHYTLIKDNTLFMFENTVNYPFIVNASKLFSNMVHITDMVEDGDHRVIVKDITPRVVCDGKIVFSNKDKHLDFSELFENDITLRQKLLVTVGYDVPSYLALKNIEDKIQKVSLILDHQRENNFCTMYLKIDTDDRSIYSVNIENKFLKVGGVNVLPAKA